MDRFSPVAPARVRVLLLPVGQIEGRLFNKVVDELLKNASTVLLKDLPAEDENFTLSPLKSPQGSVLLNYTTSDATEQLRQLSPFELWRETLLVIGITTALSQDGKQRTSELKNAGAELHERHSRVVHRHLLVLDDGKGDALAGDVVNVTLDEELQLFPAVKQITVRFLQELNTYLIAMQASPSIQTPGQTSQGMLRAMLLREEDGRPGSRQGTPLEPRSPSGEENGSRPTSQDIMPPATTFDQIPAANSLGRSDSNTSRRSKSRSRAMSFERVPVHNLSKDKLKDRGRARVSIVAGSIYLMAGQWSEALKLLVESTTRLRSLHDHIWNGKGLELIVVCLILQLWAGLDVQVPAVCFQLSGKVRDRLSKSFAAELAQKLTSPQTPLERLSSSLHDLSKHVLLLYHSIEDNIELPYIVVAEATVRFCKILACLQSTDGFFTAHSISWLVEHQSVFPTSTTWSSSPFQATKPLTKAGISDMLTNALPLSDESISLPEHINILTGVASVYAVLKMERKKAITLKALVARLTTALHQARKLGAAEMGIHPAATLSAENGTETLLNTVQGSTGLTQLAQSLASVYGVQMRATSQPDAGFGNRTLQIEILRDLLRLCEASPDLEGISRLVVAFMTSADQHEAIDLTAASRPVSVPVEEQTRLLGMFHKATWLLKQLELNAEEVSYWDPFIVRGIDLVGLPEERIIEELALTSRPSTGTSAGNPLLYDPNAPRPQTVKQKIILAQGETAQFCISLQNPHDVPIDIEQLSLVGDGVALKSATNNVRLRPASIDRVVVDVQPTTIGAATLTGCRLKIMGCSEQTFRITLQPWRASDRPLIKAMGQVALHTTPAGANYLPPYNTVDVEVVEPQPQLLLLKDETTSDPMLLEGENRSYLPVFQNVSQTKATILQLACHTDNISTTEQFQVVDVAPGGVFSPRLQIKGNPSVNSAHASIVYATSASSSLSRRYVLQPKLSNKPALRVVHLEVDPGEGDLLLVTLDLLNYWQQPVEYRCHSDSPDAGPLGTLAAGEATRVQLKIRRPAQSQKSGPAVMQADFFKKIQIAWSTAGHSGSAILKDIILSERALALLRQPATSVSLERRDVGTSNIAVGEFATIRATITTTLQMSGPYLIQLRQRALQSAATERQAALTGSMSRIVSTLTAEQATIVDFTLCPLLTGPVVLDAVLKSAQPTGAETLAESISTQALRLHVVE